MAARGDGALLRAEILAATVALAEELDDPGKLSLRAVARRVGVTATSIYLHFDSLDALLVAVKMHLWQRFSDAMSAGCGSGGSSPYDRVLGFSRAYVAFADEHSGAFRTLFTKAWSLPLVDGQSFVGAAPFELIVDAVAEVSDTTQEAHLRATQLWCALQGLVVLHQSMSRFPWPDQDEQLRSLARAWTTPHSSSR